MPTPQHEAAIRFGCFFGTLLVMAAWELLAPRRPLTQSKPLRWFSNLGLAVLNNVVWRVLIPAGAIGLAMSVQARGWGLFNQVALPEWFEVAASVVLFDLATYAQHWIFHRVRGCGGCIWCITSISILMRRPASASTPSRPFCRSGGKPPSSRCSARRRWRR